MFRFIFRIIVCAVCAFLPSCRLLAQDIDTLQHEMLRDVEVVADRVPSEVASSAPLQVVESEEFMRLGHVSLSDAVKRMSGVDVQDYGGVGGLKTVSVRGMGAKHTAVSYDGVVVGDAQSGIVDIGRYSLDNISYISLLAGQGSKIFMTAREYSSAGLLSLVTRRPQKTSLGFTARTGSFGYASAFLRGNYCFSRGWAISLNGSFVRSDGMYPFTLKNSSVSSREKRKDGDFELWQFEGNAFGSLYGGNLALKVYFFDSERGLPGAVNLYNKENSERLWNKNFFVQAKYERKLLEKLYFKGIGKFDYNSSRYVEVNKNYASGCQVDKNWQKECYSSLGVLYKASSNFSLSFTNDVAYTSLDNNFVASKSPRRLSLQSVLAAAFSVGRVDVTASLLGTYMADKISNGVEPSPYKRLSPALGFSCRPFASLPLRLRFSVKDSYRIPTFADLYYLRLGNVGLRPERATQFNFGVTYSAASVGVLDYLSISVDGYYNNVRDKIVALPTMYIWRMTNFGEACMAGADISAMAHFSLSRNVMLLSDVSYSYNYAVDITDPAARNYRDQLPYTPRHSGSFSLALETPVVNVAYILSAVGERYMLPQNNERNRMHGYVEHSFSLNKEIRLSGARARLQCELLNVGDRQYEVIRYYPMPGFSWRFSVSLYI